MSRAGRAVPFIELAGDKFVVTDEGRQFLSNVQGPISTVAVVGKYRTGKSFLMNRILLDRGDGFTVGPTVNACTKGLWIWTEVIPSHRDDGKPVNILVIDTEGIGALSADHTHDTRIFTLALLLSSLFVYNSTGAIDEAALSNLGLIVNLTKHIQVHSGTKGEDDGSDFATFFPEFLWILRDFALILKDANGRSMSPKEYLEAGLAPQKGASEAIEQKNRVRRLLSGFFQTRDCVTLVRPVEDETLLQSLDSVAVEQLRPEFAIAMRALRSRILGQAPVKTLHGRELDGPALISLAESYSHAINSGSVPNIGEAWDALCLTQNERRIDTAISDFKAKSIDKLRKLIPCSPKSLRLGFDVAVQEAVAAIRKDGYGDAAAVDACAARLTQCLGDLIDSILSENERIGADQCHQILRELYEPISIKLQENGFKSLAEYEQQRSSMLSVYNEKAPSFSMRNEIMLQFSLESLSSAAQSISSASAASAEHSLRQLRDTMESELRAVVEERANLSKERDVALIRCESLSSALSESKERGDAIKKSSDLAESAFREEKNELKSRIKEVEGFVSSKDEALRAAETKAVMLQSERDMLEKLVKQNESALQEHKQQSSAVEDRLRKQLDDLRSSSDAAVAEVRAQFRSDLNERDSRVKEMMSQLELCRAELLAARSEAASQQQTCSLIQAEMVSKLSAAAAAAEQQHASFLQKHDAAEAAFKAQEADLRAALSRDQASLSSLKDAVKDAQAQSFAAEAARDAMSTALEQQQRHNASIIDALKSAAPSTAPTSSVHSESVLSDVFACNAATIERISQTHAEERSQLFAVIKRLQNNCEEMLLRQRDLEIGAALAVIESSIDPKSTKDSLSKSLAMQEACYGSSSVHIVDSLFRLAVCAGLNGDHAAKATLLERSLCIIDANGSVSPLIIGCLHHLACAYEALGLMKKSSVAAERALQLQESQSPTHYLISVLLECIGRVKSHCGMHDKAASAFERALQLKEQQNGPNDVALVSCLIGLAAAHRSLNDKDQARLYSERAYKLCNDNLGSEHPFTAVAMAHAAYSCVVCGGDASQLKLQLQRLEQASTIVCNSSTPLHANRFPSTPALATPSSHLPSSPISIPVTPYASMPMTPNSSGRNDPSTSHVSTPIQAGLTQPTVMSLDAATVNIFLAQSLFAADVLPTSLMSYAEGMRKLRLLKSALSCRQMRLPPQHPDVASAMYLYACAAGEAGDMPLKRDLCAQALEIYEMHVPSDSLDLVPVLVNLAAATVGDSPARRQLLERALCIKEQHVGDAHPDLARLLAPLANAVGDCGDVQRKKELLLRALALRETAFGLTHPDLTSVIVNLGNTYGVLGEAQKKKELLERALAIQQAHFGSEHIEVAAVIVNLANAHGALGDIAKKREMLQQALRIQEAASSSSEDSVRNMVSTLVNLGNACGDENDHVKKKELLERALHMQEALMKDKTSGSASNELSNILLNLGTAYGDLGDFSKQRDVLERTLRIKESQYGEDHFELAKTLTNLGIAYGNLKHLKEGQRILMQRDLLERSLRIKERHYGADNYEMVSTLATLAQVHGTMKSFSKQQELFSRVLAVEEQHFGSNSKEVAQTLCDLAEAHACLNDRPTQLQLLQRALIIQETVFGPGHEEVRLTLEELADAYGSSGDVAEQQKCKQRSEAILANQ